MRAVENNPNGKCSSVMLKSSTETVSLFIWWFSNSIIPVTMVALSLSPGGRIFLRCFSHLSLWPQGWSLGRTRLMETRDGQMLSVLCCS